MIRNCYQCKTDFNFRACPTDLISGRGKFCSVICKRLSRKTLPSEFDCLKCGVKMPNLYGKKRYYCKDCKWKIFVGKKPWNFGLKNVYSVETLKKIREAKFKIDSINSVKRLWGIDEIKWSKAVRKKFNFTCCYCGSKNKIHAHHIKEWAE